MLQAPGLSRIAALVHYLDVGGSQPAEASGIERVLAGLRESITDDNQLMAAANGIFDGLLAAFANEETVMAETTTLATGEAPSSQRPRWACSKRCCSG